LLNSYHVSTDSYIKTRNFLIEKLTDLLSIIYTPKDDYTYYDVKEMSDWFMEVKTVIGSIKNLDTTINKVLHDFQLKNDTAKGIIEKLPTLLREAKSFIMYTEYPLSMLGEEKIQKLTNITDCHYIVYDNAVQVFSDLNAIISEGKMAQDTLGLVGVI
jgi:hypothetical protein